MAGCNACGCTRLHKPDVVGDQQQAKRHLGTAVYKPKVGCNRPLKPPPVPRPSLLSSMLYVSRLLRSSLLCKLRQLFCVVSCTHCALPHSPPDHSRVPPSRLTSSQSNAI